MNKHSLNLTKPLKKKHPKEINHQLLRLCGSWTIAWWTHPSMHTNPWKTMEHDCNLEELDTGNWLSLKHVYFLYECLRCMELCEWNQYQLSIVNLEVIRNSGILETIRIDV